MSVYNLDFWGKSKIDYSIEFVKSFGESMLRVNPDDRLYVCFSGGKDSVVLAEIVRRSGVPFELHYNITGLDYPETMRFIRNYDGVIMHQHEKSFFQLLKENKILPTRQVRYCCKYLKEGGGANRFVCTGVRWAESQRRKNNRHTFESGDHKVFFNDNDTFRRQIEFCTLKGRKVCNPIIQWEDAEIWEFIRKEKLPYCELYDQGKKRIGCMFCPMASKKDRLSDCEKYPKMAKNIIKTLDYIQEQRLKNGELKKERTGKEWFNIWINGGSFK